MTKARLFFSVDLLHAAPRKFQAYFWCSEAVTADLPGQEADVIPVRETTAMSESPNNPQRREAGDKSTCINKKLG